MLRRHKGLRTLTFVTALYNAFIALYISSVGGSTSEPAQSQAEQYRDLVIIAAMGIPGSIIATGAVELPYLGRRFAMAFFTLLTGYVTGKRTQLMMSARR